MINKKNLLSVVLYILYTTVVLYNDTAAAVMLLWCFAFAVRAVPGSIISILTPRRQLIGRMEC